MTRIPDLGFWSATMFEIWVFQSTVVFVGVGKLKEAGPRGFQRANSACLDPGSFSNHLGLLRKASQATGEELTTIDSLVVSNWP